MKCLFGIKNTYKKEDYHTQDKIFCIFTLILGARFEVYNAPFVTTFVSASSASRLKITRWGYLLGNWHLQKLISFKKLTSVFDLQDAGIH